MKGSPAPFSRHLLLWILLWILLSNLLVIVLATRSLLETRQDREQETQAAVENLSLVLEREIASSFDKVDLGLQDLADTYAHEIGRAHFDSAAWNAMLIRQRTRHTLLNGLRASDAAGNVRYGLEPGSKSGTNIADRDYFQHLREHPDAGLVITRPLLGRTTQTWVIGLVRRLNAPDGSFAGVIYATVPLDHFRQIFAELKLGPNAAIAFRDAALRLIVRQPALKGPGEIGATTISDNFKSALLANPDGGSYSVGTGSLDGIERLHAFRRNRTYGFYVNVGFAREDFLKEWWNELAKMLGVVVIFGVVTTLLGWQMHRTWRIRQAGLNAVQASEARFRSLFEHMTEGMALHKLVYGPDGKAVNYRILDTNPAFEAHTGLSPVQVRGKLATEAYDTASAPFLDIYAKVVSTGQKADFDNFVPELDRHFRIRAYSPQPGQFATVFEDITARRKVEDKVRLMATVFSNSNESILITDAGNRIIAVNSAFTELTGYSAKEVLGKDPHILSAGKTPREVIVEMWKSIERNGRWEGELWDRSKSGDIYPKWLSISVVRGPDGKISNYIGSFVDIKERKASEEKVRHLAHHDTLTNLPNRYSLHERLQHALGSAKREGRQLALMLIDLDRFKIINDTLGHHVGDHLLIQVAQRLTQSVRSSDIVARLGGDEFVVILPGIDTAADAAQVAGKISQTVSEPYLIEGAELNTSPSIGICFYPEDAEEVGSLLKNADVAMYRAKSLGGGNYQFFTAQI
ncbi:MAG: diguanylate cyclase [Sterolibacterium sp.]